MSKAEPSGGNASQVQVEPAENQIVVYQPNETVRLDVRLAKKAKWTKRIVCIFCKQIPKGDQRSLTHRF